MLAVNQIKISIVTTVYKSLVFLPEFIDQTLTALKTLGELNFELVFVLDGITDESLAYLVERKKDVPQIVIVELSRNFGHHYAITAGLKTTKGDLVFLIDCDLEVSPQSLVLFMNEYSKDTSQDVIYGFQEQRKGKFFERVFGGVFWNLFNLLSDTKVPANIITERLMSRNYINSLLKMGDKNLFLAGIMYWVGYNQKAISIQKRQRSTKSSYSLFQRSNLLLEAVTSFSEKPLKLIFYFGLLTFFLSVAAVIFLLTKKIVYPDSILVGYTSTIVVIFLLFSILILSIGTASLYLSRVFKQVQDRPKFIIKSIH